MDGAAEGLEEGRRKGWNDGGGTKGGIELDGYFASVSSSEDSAIKWEIRSLVALQLWRVEVQSHHPAGFIVEEHLRLWNALYCA